VSKTFNFLVLLLSAVAVQDPANTIKRDLYALSEQFDALETNLSRTLQRSIPRLPESSEPEVITSIVERDSSAADNREDDDETSDYSLSKNSSHRGAADTATDQSSGDQPSGLTECEGSNSGGTGGDASDQFRTGGHSEDTCYSSSVLNSEEASVISLPVAVAADVPVSHYEECTVTSTVTLGFKPRQPAQSAILVEKSEVFLNMAAVRDPSELERDLEAAQQFLSSPLRLANSEDMEDELAVLAAHLARLEDAFLPASFTEEESTPILADLVEVKGRLRSRQAEAKDMKERLAQCQEEMSGLGLWMKEVKAFLGAEEAAYGELETLEAQLRESNALQVFFCKIL
jgi:hypothetical protein